MYRTYEKYAKSFSFKLFDIIHFYEKHTIYKTKNQNVVQLRFQRLHSLLSFKNDALCSLSLKKKLKTFRSSVLTQKNRMFSSRKTTAYEFIEML